LGLGEFPYVPTARAGFLSPEQLMGRVGTYQSDIFSLGVLAYLCLAGRPPFEGDSALEVALHVVRSEPPPLPSDVPSEVRSIVERAMAKDPADRWSSVAEFAAAAREVEWRRG
jgi:serine/threonine-protein kinase